MRELHTNAFKHPPRPGTLRLCRRRTAFRADAQRKFKAAHNGSSNQTCHAPQLDSRGFPFGTIDAEGHRFHPEELLPQHRSEGCRRAPRRIATAPGSEIPRTAQDIRREGNRGRTPQSGLFRAEIKRHHAKGSRKAVRLCGCNTAHAPLQGQIRHDGHPIPSRFRRLFVALAKISARPTGLRRGTPARALPQARADSTP